MNKPYYEFYNTDNIYFSFTSIGRNGEIDKIVKFEKIHETAFNLCLGDRVGTTDNVNDQTITNNGDMPKVFATVFRAVELFFSSYPDKLLVIEGNTSLKNKLYKRIISNNFHHIDKEYFVYGSIADKWEEFDSNKDYEYFVIGKK